MTSSVQPLMACLLPRKDNRHLSPSCCGTTHLRRYDGIVGHLTESPRSAADANLCESFPRAALAVPRLSRSARHPLPSRTNIYPQVHYECEEGSAVHGLGTCFT